jgi:pimeloyl-ACP methyl ester carboxylesterase
MYLVTGAAGFLGSTVCRQLIDRGEMVRALVLSGDKSAQFLPEEVEIVYGDLCNKEDLERFLICAEDRSFDMRKELQNLKCPLFVANAEDDLVLGSDSQKAFVSALNGRPDFTVHMYRGYGHAAYDFAPDFKERMKQFFLREDG